MNSVPAEFVSHVCHLAKSFEYPKLDGLFGSIGGFRDTFTVFLLITYDPETDNVKYCFTRKFFGGVGSNTMLPYTYSPADNPMIYAFFITVVPFILTAQQFPWTTIERSDPILKMWLNASIDIVALSLRFDCDCSRILDLISETTTFDYIGSDGECSDALRRIITRSNDAKRLRTLDCSDSFASLTTKEIIRFQMKNERLRDSCPDAAVEALHNCIFVRQPEIRNQSVWANFLIDACYLWAKDPSMFTRTWRCSSESAEVLHSIKRFGFELSGLCSCETAKSGYSCLHFIVNHPFSPGKQLQLMLLSKKSWLSYFVNTGFQTATSVEEALQYEIARFTLEFCVDK